MATATSKWKQTKKFMRTGTCANTCEEQHPTYRTVKGKLEKMVFDPPKTDEEMNLEELAKILMDEEKVKSKYFADIIRKISISLISATRDIKHYANSKIFNNDEEEKLAFERAAFDLNTARDVQIKLLWYQLKQKWQGVASVVCPMLHKVSGKLFVYGPYHVALLVGNVIVEWSDSSLIIPHVLDPKEPGCMPYFHALISEPQPPIAAPTDIDSFKYITGEVPCAVQSTVCLINQICEMIVKYNTSQVYNVITCNCQHFAVDMLEALGRSKDAEMFNSREVQIDCHVVDELQ